MSRLVSYDEARARTFGLNYRQRLFVENYILTVNAVEAARAAGYRAAEAAATRLMAHPGVIAYLQDNVDQTDGMKADEVLYRLTEQARNLAAYYLKKDGSYDIEGLVEDEMQHLVKKISRKTIVKPRGTVEEYFDLEFYDAQAALVHLGKVHRLFTVVTENKETRTYELGDKMTQALDKIYGGHIDGHSTDAEFTIIEGTGKLLTDGKESGDAEGSGGNVFEDGVSAAPEDDAIPRSV